MMMMMISNKRIHVAEELGNPYECELRGRKDLRF